MLKDLCSSGSVNGVGYSRKFCLSSVQLFKEIRHMLSVTVSFLWGFNQGFRSWSWSDVCSSFVCEMYASVARSSLYFGCPTLGFGNCCCFAVRAGRWHAWKTFHSGKLPYPWFQSLVLRRITSDLFAPSLVQWPMVSLVLVWWLSRTRLPGIPSKPGGRTVRSSVTVDHLRMIMGSVEPLLMGSFC